MIGDEDAGANGRRMEWERDGEGDVCI